jgi:hypothetical protein
MLSADRSAIDRGFRLSAMGLRNCVTNCLKHSIVTNSLPMLQAVNTSQGGQPVWRHPNSETSAGSNGNIIIAHVSKLMRRLLM